MSARAAKRSASGLLSRQFAWDNLHIDKRRGTTRPGSLNRKKNPQASTHKGKRR